MTNTNVIAEIGCNHKGDIKIAKKMIDTASKFCNAKIVKFQKRNNKILLSDKFDQPHPVPENAYGKSYGLHREFLEFNIDQHQELMEHSKDLGVTYSCSVWDIVSCKEICALNPKFIKIPSAKNLNFDMHKYLIDEFDGEIHISTGMTTKSEIKKIVDFYKDRNRANNIVLYLCTSNYPVEIKDLCLLEIKNLFENFGNIVNSIGFSGHHTGISSDIAAHTIGKLSSLNTKAKFSYIERHFTLNRAWKGTDHAASLEPDGLRRLIRNINDNEIALTYKDKDILDVELEQLKKLKR